jgi:hypothetical protein
MPARTAESQTPPVSSLPDLLLRNSLSPVTLDSLKEEYLRCLAGMARGIEPLRHVIRRLLDLGVHKKTLLEWATAAGYSDSHVRSVINRLLREAGARSRKPGAGRRTSQKSLKIMTFAIVTCGESEAGKHLLSAYHAWHVRMVAGKSQAQAA